MLAIFSENFYEILSLYIDYSHYNISKFIRTKPFICEYYLQAFKPFRLHTNLINKPYEIS